ncbi:carbonic anhydrase [Mycena epipterygia]|nr:carbonic anhydrase [Mycena epipterygia]
MIPTSTPSAQDLLPRNAAWAQQIEANDPGYFPCLAAKAQQPKVLWIGCADSRVPETTICDCTLGDLFTHRNIANMVVASDDSAQAVILHAVESLRVEDIVVVGHTQCGGVEAALAAAREQAAVATRAPKPVVPADAPLSRWLVPLVQVAKDLGLHLSQLGEEAALRQLAEENIRRQVVNLSNLRTVQDADPRVRLSGWLFEMETGRLVDVSDEAYTKTAAAMS